MTGSAGIGTIMRADRKLSAQACRHGPYPVQGTPMNIRASRASIGIVARFLRCTARRKVMKGPGADR